MATKDNNILLIGALAVGAYLWYKNSQAAAGATGSGGILPPAVIPPGTTAVMSTGNLAAPPSDTLSVATGVTNPGDTIILNWFTQLSPANAAQALAQWPHMTTDDKAGLYDLIVNDWQGGQGNTPERITFWNTWRVKYHVNDGTYN